MIKILKKYLYNNFMCSFHCSTKLQLTNTEEVVKDCFLNELHALLGEKHIGKQLILKFIYIHYSMPFN